MKKKNFYKKKFMKLNPKIIWVSVFVLMASLVSSLIFQFSYQTKEIYLLHSYKENTETLLEENNSLEISLSKINSWEKIENFAKDMNFEKSDSTKYVKLAGNTIAKIEK